MNKEFTQENIGKLLIADTHRDAIHIAVAPVIAAESLSPGDHVGFIDGGVGIHAAKLIGIVDPFISDEIKVGTRFYMFLYPNTITGLRHEWTHPAFSDGGGPKFASEAWMREWAINNMGDDYYGECARLTDEQAYANAINAGHSGNVGPYENARDSMDDEWWHHWQAITGSRKQKPDYFSCGC